MSSSEGTGTREILIPIESPSDNAHAVVLVKHYAKDWGFDVVTQSLIGTSVSELATNIIKYAVTGSLSVSRIIQERRIGIEITARDGGPGIPDISRALCDEFSTGGSLGFRGCRGSKG